MSQATLDDVRGGCEMVFLGRGMGMKNYNHDAEEKFAGMYQDCYPIKFKVMAIVDAPFLIWALMKLASVRHIFQRGRAHAVDVD